MASVKSLGLHQPSGLRHAIEEQLLPANAPSSSYTWDILTDDRGHEQVEDELLTTETSVVWCRGRIFRKTFKFNLEKEPITQALLAYFPASQDEKIETNNAAATAAPSLEKALVVFLKTQAHVYLLSGTSHIIHMPFEVESACAGPIGVIIQRKQKAENLAPIALKFPRVPPNSFVSSQPAAFNSSHQTTFSVEGLGRPKSLHLGLSSTLEHMWEMPLAQPESRWPRLLSLTDPLLDLGLVVTNSESHNTKLAKKNPSKRPNFLDAAEEILHIEQIELPGISAHHPHEPLIIAITINREANSYTVWRLSYLKHDDPFIKKKKMSKTTLSRRRSSMQPGFTSGTSTPVQPNMRDSFGAPLPGKRPRKSEKVEKPMDLVSSLEKQDKEDTGVTRRSSRRLSSMLARADLSASYERSAFPDQPLATGSGPSKRNESFGGLNPRASSVYNHQIHPSLGSLLEAPLDFALDEGFNSMGLDDHEFDGLQHEILFAKVHTITIDSSNVRYSSSSQPARQESKVFVLTAPTFATGDQLSGQLLIGIQESVEKRLQLINIYLRVQQKFDLVAKAGRKNPTGIATVTLVPGELRRAQNVVDSCKLVDGDQSVILVLSEAMDGRHELSTQAPWSELTKLSLSLLFVDDTRSLQYCGREVDRDVQQRKSEVMDLSNGSIIGVRYPRHRGVVDVVDTQGRLHQLRIQLQPTCPQVCKILDVCRSILPECLGERIHAGWLHIMQWLHSIDENIANIEWSALTILLLTMFLNLEQADVKPPSTEKLPLRKKRPASGSFTSIRDSDDWKSMMKHETANSIGCPTWMMNRGWQWTLDEDIEDVLPFHANRALGTSFISRHIVLGREYVASPLGVAAFGPSGYMPTSSNKSSDSRRKAAVDVFMALHLLQEEQKLNIMSPEYSPAGRADFRVVLCQIARWLRWHNFSSVYEFGIQEDIDPRHDSGQ